MGVLSSLLPGLREFRSPLAAGYLWVTTMALVWIDLSLEGEDASSYLSNFFGFGQWLGKAGTLAVVGFAAYIVGILSVSVTNPAVQRAARKHRAGKRAAPGLADAPLSLRGIDALRGFVLDKSAEMLKAEPSSLGLTQPALRLLSRNPDSEALLAAIGSNLHQSGRIALVRSHLNIDGQVHSIIDDLELVPKRFAANRSDVYANYDRQVAEGEFRAAIALPILFLGIVISTGVDPAFAWGVAILAMVLTTSLFWQARGRIIDAYDGIAEIVRATGGAGLSTLSQVSEEDLVIEEPALTDSETAIFTSLANKALEAGRLVASREWLDVLSKTGDRHANEIRCDVLRATQEYAVDVLLIEALSYAAKVSGRSALELALMLAEQNDSANGSGASIHGDGDGEVDHDMDAKERGYAFGRALLLAWKDSGTRDFASKAMKDVYQHLGPGTMDMFQADMRAVSTGEISENLVYRRYDPPDDAAMRAYVQPLTREVMRIRPQGELRLVASKS